MRQKHGQQAQRQAREGNPDSWHHLTGPHDRAQGQTAARMQHHNPHWVIMWGTYSRRYWAFPRFNALPGTVVTAVDAAGLTARLRHVKVVTERAPWSASA